VDARRSGIAAAKQEAHLGRPTPTMMLTAALAVAALAPADDDNIIVA
jgi:hypothetical protein